MNLELCTNPNQLGTWSFKCLEYRKSRVPLLYPVLLGLASSFLGLPRIQRSQKSQRPRISIFNSSHASMIPSVTWNLDPERCRAIACAPKTQANPCWMDGQFISKASQYHCDSNVKRFSRITTRLINGKLCLDWLWMYTWIDGHQANYDCGPFLTFTWIWRYCCLFQNFINTTNHLFQ